MKSESILVGVYGCSGEMQCKEFANKRVQAITAVKMNLWANGALRISRCDKTMVAMPIATPVLLLVS